MTVSSPWVVHAGGEGGVGNHCRSVGRAHIVGVVGCGTAVRSGWGSPAVAMYLEVVGVAVVEHRVVEVAHEWVVWRHCPVEVGRCHRTAEPQVLSCAVHSMAV